jgi:hypothetical protein
MPSRRSNPRPTLLLALGVSVITLTWVSPAGADTMFITDFAKNGNMQNTLQSSFPSGLFTANNSFHTRFNITSDANGDNFAQLFGNDGQIFHPGSYTVNVGVAGVTDVYTLMNAYAPTRGLTLSTVEFVGSGGADEVFALVNGTDVRDFFRGGFANTINGTTTQNAFEIDNVQGGAGTGNSHTGAVDTYLIDEQHFVLDPSFASQTLQEILYTYPGNAGTPILEGVTVQTAAPGTVPEPSSLILCAVGALGMAGYAWRRRR